MSLQPSRPKNLNLFTIKFPLPAIVSILHRVSGIIVFVCIPFFLWGLSLSLTSQGFEKLLFLLRSNVVKCMLWLILIPFCFHFIAGIRHLLMDIHMGQTLKMGRLTAVLTFILTILLLLLLGVWLW